MCLREILVFLDASSATDRRLQLAAGLAAEQRAGLTAVFVYEDQSTEPVGAPAQPTWGFVAQLIPGAAVIQRSAMAAEASERRFRECLHSVGIDGDWHYVNKRDLAQLVGVAQAADLLVVGQVDPYTRSAPRWRPHDTVTASGRPALVIPYAGNFPRVGRRVLVAWNGSAQAARALHYALPIMRNAHAVIVLTVCDRENDLRQYKEASMRIVRHLGQHGIAARADHTMRGANSISDVLLSAAMDHSSDLIVAGGCFYSPLREALVSGTGRHLLQTITIPLLTSQ